MMRKLSDLKPHPKNQQIYHDKADNDLVKSVREKGLLHALLITKDGLIISGHRRFDAAKQAGLTEVPTVTFGSDDPLDVLEALVEANRSRVKTNEQIGREAAILLEVEQERAKQRQEATQSKPGQQVGQVVGLGPPPETNGKARDLVGEKVGTNGKTAEQAAKVVQAIDGLESNGKKREATQLRAALNKNVRKAYNDAKEKGLVKVAAPKTEGKPKTKNYFTLAEWKEMPTEERQKALKPCSTSSRFNAQDDDSIEWALWSS